MKFSDFWAQIQALSVAKKFKTVLKNTDFIACYYPGRLRKRTYDGFKQRDPPQWGVVVVWAGKGLNFAPKPGEPYLGPPTYRDGTWTTLKREFEEVWERAKTIPLSMRWSPGQYINGRLSNNRTGSYIVSLEKYYLGDQKME